MSWIPVVGADPSLTATGIVALLVRTAEADPSRVKLDVKVVRRVTVSAPKNGSMPIRLDALYLDCERAFKVARDNLFADLLSMGEPTIEPVMVMEDPMDFTIHGGGRLRSADSLHKIGAAVATVMLAASAAFGAENVQAYGTKAWLPRTGGHFMKKELHIRLLRNIYRPLLECNGDEVMAAGVALHHMRSLTRRRTAVVV